MFCGPSSSNFIACLQGTRAKEYEVPQDYYQAIPIENTEPMSRSSQHTEVSKGQLVYKNSYM